MKHSRCLVGLALTLALTVAACGSASSGFTTASRLSAQVKPSQPVPASAARRLTAITDRVVTLNGGHGEVWATAVLTTLGRALTSATPGDTTPGQNEIVYLVTIKGHFVCNLCTGPAGSRKITGTYMSIVIDARTFGETAFSLGPKPPPVSPSRFGPVTYLKIHPGARR